MKVQFLAAATARVIARVVDQDALPSNLETVLAEGARASRFTGKTGQLFEGFVERGGSVVRAALAGADCATTTANQVPSPR